MSPEARSVVLMPRIDASLRFQGAASCAASACHGGQEPDARPQSIRRDEYTVWSHRDPHSRAYAVLANDRSKRMLKLLAIRPGDGRYENCLACHSPASWNIKRGEMANRMVPSSQEGVACESCHGPAERWRTKHFLLDWDPSHAEQVGMVDMDNALIRARLCADCHLGSPEREVNHDLLAAGHPPLHFDYAALHRKMPKHWNETDSPRSAASGRWSAEAAGSVAAAEAALELLAARSSSTRSGWPEFATARCTSCHHRLRAGELRDASRPIESATGMRFEDEFLTWIETKTARSAVGSPAHQLHTSLGELRRLMNSHSQPDPATVHRAARTSLDHLHSWLSG